MAGTAVASSTPESQINVQSGAPALVDLLKYFGGQKGAGTENVVSTGDTAALQRILATLNPADLQNLVAQLFSQGANQVPALTAQFANATGSRVNNNTALAQSLALLHQNLAQTIAQAVVQQQGVAVNAAGKIADVNRTQQTQKQTQEGGNVGKSLAVGAGTVAGGHLLSKLGDKLLGPSKAATPAPVSTAPIDVAPDVAPVSFTPSPDSGMPITVTGDNGFGDFTGPAAGISSGIDTALSAGAGADAASTAVDAGSAASAGDAIDYDFGDVGDDLFGGADFSFGFADGGMIRNRNYVPRPNISPSLALQVSPETSRQVPQSAKTKKPDTITTDDIEGGNNAPVAPSLSTSNVAAPFSPGIASAQGLAALAMTSNPIAAAAAFSQSVAVQSLVHSIVSMVNNLMSPTEAADNSAVAVGPNGDPNSGVAGTGVGNASTAGMGLGGPGSTEGIADASDSIGVDATAGIGGPAAADDADASGVGIGDAGVGVGAGDGSSDGDGGAAADGADGTGLKDGGYIRPRNSMQLGIDKIPARLSPAEYVLPADVVSFIGKDSLDALVDMVHAPIKGGRNG